MPTRFAARKWPSSWTNTRTPSTNANDRIVITSGSSDLQFYPARLVHGTAARPFVDLADLSQRRHRRRAMRLHHALDDARNRGKPDPAVEKPRHGDFVRRVEHDR